MDTLPSKLARLLRLVDGNGVKLLPKQNILLVGRDLYNTLHPWAERALWRVENDADIAEWFKKWRRYTGIAA